MKIEYLTEKYSIRQILKLFDYGYRYDMQRHGYKLKDEPDEDWDELRNLYYTKDELKAQREAMGK